MKNIFLAITILFLIACKTDDPLSNDTEGYDLDAGYSYETSDQYGNRLALFGGSVAYLSTPCQTYWAEKLDLSIVNFAIGGAGFTTKGNLILSQVERALSGYFGQFDIYLFWCSTNDLSNGAIGQPSDSAEFDPQDTNITISQCSGINWCFKRILTAQPQAKIILFTSLPQFGEFGHATTATKDHTYLFQLVNAQIACCKLWAIPFLDQYYTCPFNISNYQHYYDDIVHPNSNGYEMIMKQQALFIAEAY